MKDYLKDYVTDFITGRDPYQPAHPELLQDLQEYGTRQSDAFTGQKAHRLYVKALMRKSAALANRIKTKYGNLFPKPDDTSIALGFALMAASKRP